MLIGLYIWHAAVAGQAALIDLSLLRHRGFAAAAALIPAAGSAVRLADPDPLYYQVIRHAGPAQTGLLLAPQGVGAALALPVAGLLTDRIGARWVCSAGLLLALLGALGYTQLGAHTSDAYLGAVMFVLGAGIGSTISPSMAAASRPCPGRDAQGDQHAEHPAAHRGRHRHRAVRHPAAARHHGQPAQPSGQRPAVASAFGSTFWVAVALIAATLVPALLLPRPARANSSAERGPR